MTDLYPYAYLWELDCSPEPCGEPEQDEVPSDDVA